LIPQLAVAKVVSLAPASNVATPIVLLYVAVASPGQLMQMHAQIILVIVVLVLYGTPPPPPAAYVLFVLNLVVE